MSHKIHGKMFSMLVYMYNYTGPTNRWASRPQWQPSPTHTTTPWTRPSPHRTYPSKLENCRLSLDDLCGININIYIEED